MVLEQEGCVGGAKRRGGGGSQQRRLTKTTQRGGMEDCLREGSPGGRRAGQLEGGGGVRSFLMRAVGSPISTSGGRRNGGLGKRCTLRKKSTTVGTEREGGRSWGGDSTDDAQKAVTQGVRAGGGVRSFGRVRGNLRGARGHPPWKKKKNPPKNGRFVWQRKGGEREKKGSNYTCFMEGIDQGGGEGGGR